MVGVCGRCHSQWPSHPVQGRITSALRGEAATYSSARSNSRRYTRNRSNTMETLKLTAPDISCEHCQHTIEQAVGAMPGVKQVSVAIEPKEVTVEFDPAQVS
ncbi:MAG TPA: heavy-metal-associated domain-containing protein, partial [Dehalococcoidia bacterium]